MEMSHVKKLCYAVKVKSNFSVTAVIILIEKFVVLCLKHWNVGLSIAFTVNVTMSSAFWIIVSVNIVS